MLRSLYIHFPGGSPPANAGDTGLIPGQGRPHMPQSNYACAAQLLSLCSRGQEVQLLKTTRVRACALQREKPLP